MKTSYTVPSISSLAENEIKDLQDIKFYLPELRLVKLPGVSVRIEINNGGYVELNSKEEVDISKYFDVLKNVSNFFYGTGYLFGRVNNGELVIYDIYTNDNYLSTRDMKYLEENYSIPIVKPIAEGRFTFEDILEIMHTKLSDGEDLKNYFILPKMYLNDNREYTAAKVPVISKIIIGEKKSAEKTYYNTNTSSITNTTASTVNTSSAEEEDLIVEETKIPRPEIFSISTKDERSEIFKEIRKNVETRFNSIKNTLSPECIAWYKKYGCMMTYIYAIHTLPKTRNLVYNYAKDYWIPNYTVNTIEEEWANLFLDFFAEKYSLTTLYSRYPTFENTMDYEYFAEIFKDEINVFDDFYSKEVNKFEDWRVVGGTFGV